MSKLIYSAEAELRGASLREGGVARAARLKVGQPLLLEREPTNAVDCRAVLVKDVLGDFVGYVAAERAGPISVLMEAGQVPLAWVTGVAVAVKVGGRPRLKRWPTMRIEVRGEEASASSRSVVREDA